MDRRAQQAHECFLSRDQKPYQLHTRHQCPHCEALNLASQQHGSFTNRHSPFARCIRVYALRVPPCARVAGTVPLFVTLDQFMMMLDASLPQPFFARPSRPLTGATPAQLRQLAAAAAAAAPSLLTWNAGGGQLRRIKRRYVDVPTLGQLGGGDDDNDEDEEEAVWLRGQRGGGGGAEGGGRGTRAAIGAVGAVTHKGLTTLLLLRPLARCLPRVFVFRLPPRPTSSPLFSTRWPRLWLCARRV